MAIQDQINRITNEVGTQSDLIEQIKSALYGKAVGNKQEQTKEVTFDENGTYHIEPDEGCTLSSVDVSVAVPIGDPYEVMNSAIKGTLTEFYTLENWKHSEQSFGNLFNSQANLTKWAMPNNTNNLSGYLFRFCNSLKYIDIGKPTSCHQALFYGRNLRNMVIIIRAETPPPLNGVFSGTGFDDTTKMFVPKNSLEAYKAATNWSTYADVFYSIEDYPEEVNYDNY